jgi:hypothetical protein
VLLNLEISFGAENGFDFSNFFDYTFFNHAALIDPNLIRIMKPVGQNNIIICPFGHQSEIDQSITISNNSYDQGMRVLQNH